MNELNLKEGEKILFDCHGKLRNVILKMTPSGRLVRPFWRDPVQVSMHSGKIFITNSRIIAQGETKVKGGRFGTGSGLDLVISPLSGHSKRDKIRSDLPSDGYEVPIINIGKLRKTRNGIAFEVMSGKHPGIVKIWEIEEMENREKLFEILSNYNKIKAPNYALRRIICCVFFIIIIIVSVLVTIVNY
ncbi:MAG: hypothetical protein ACFFCL_07350 [Promethearchaeota archaeon]